MHFYAIATIYVESDPKSNIICYEWINIKARIQPDASYVVAKEHIAPKPVFPYGVYENENLSVDWLLVSKVEFYIDKSHFNSLARRINFIIQDHRT